MNIPGCNNVTYRTTFHSFLCTSHLNIFTILLASLSSLFFSVYDSASATLFDPLSTPLCIGFIALLSLPFCMCPLHVSLHFKLPSVIPIMYRHFPHFSLHIISSIPSFHSSCHIIIREFMSVMRTCLYSSFSPLP